MRMKIIIPILMMLFLTGIVYAGASVSPVIVLDQLGLMANKTYLDSSTIPYNINITDGNASSYLCWLYTNENGSNGVGTWHAKHTSVTVNNATAYNFTASTNVADTTSRSFRYAWDVYCNSSDNPIGAWGANSTKTLYADNVSMNYSVDTTAPTFTRVFPTTLLRGVSTSEWVDNGFGNHSVRVGANVHDWNPGNCTYYINYNVSTNTTGSNHSVIGDNGKLISISYVNNTAFNFSSTNTTVGFIDNSTGYSWRMVCNDSANNTASTGGTFKVDTLLPGDFSFNRTLFMTDANLLIPNNSICTDYKPQIGWFNATDTNWDHYTIRFHQNITTFGGGHTDGGYLEWNLTGQNTTMWGTTWNLTSELTPNINYTINITAFDDAGNQRVINDFYVYRVSSTYHNLTAGWNILGNPGNALTLSNIMNYTSATTVTSWNGTHEFTSHVDGGSYGDTSVAGGDPFLLYMSSAGIFNDLVRNVSAFSGLVVNITNQSNTDWNLVMNRNHSKSYNFQTLDNWLNAGGQPPQTTNESNATFLSYYNNSASTGSKYVSFVSNWSISNYTEVPSLETAWIFVNDAVTDGLQQKHTAASQANYSAEEVYQIIDWGTLS